MIYSQKKDFKDTTMTETDKDYQVTQNDFSPKFEISIFIPDAKGGCSTKKKSFSSDNAYEIYKFWMRNKGEKKRKPKKPSNEKKSN